MVPDDFWGFLAGDIPVGCCTVLFLRSCRRLLLFPIMLGSSFSSLISSWIGKDSLSLSVLHILVWGFLLRVKAKKKWANSCRWREKIYTLTTFCGVMRHHHLMIQTLSDLRKKTEPSTRFYRLSCSSRTINGLKVWNPLSRTKVIVRCLALSYSGRHPGDTLKKTICKFMMLNESWENFPRR